MNLRDIGARFARYETVASVTGGVTLLLIPAIPIMMWRIIPGFLVGSLLSVIASLVVWRTPGERWKVLLVGGVLGELVCLFVFPSAWIGTLMLWGRTGAVLGFSMPELYIDLIGFLSLMFAAWYALGMLLAGFMNVCGWMGYRRRMKREGDVVDGE